MYQEKNEYIIHKLYSDSPDIFSSLCSIKSFFHCNLKECFLVGGCVRDLLLGRIPKDYDLCTDATPDEVKKIFAGSSYHIFDSGIKHGTVTLTDPLLHSSFEITTYRVDGKYEDNRHPKDVTFTPSLEEDLKRRDFTINSFAYDIAKNMLVMLDKSFLDDLKFKVIRAVGNPVTRFNEDALRLLRAVRFASQLGFTIDSEVFNAMCLCGILLTNISKERIRDELTKILLSDNPQYLEFLSITRIDAFIGMSIITKLLNCQQHNKYHYTDVFHHTMDVVKRVPRDFICRWSAFFHDVGKPESKTTDEDGWEHFFMHNVSSQKIAISLMKDLKFDNKSIDAISSIVYNHDRELSKCSMFKYKKALNEIGLDIFDKFLEVRVADTLAHTYTLEHNHYVIDSLSIIKNRYVKILNEKQPMCLQDLEINGNDLIALGYHGKEVGEQLNKMLDFVLMNPSKNEKQVLLKICEGKK